MKYLNYGQLPEPGDETYELVERTPEQIRTSGSKYPQWLLDRGYVPYVPLPPEYDEYGNQLMPRDWQEIHNSNILAVFYSYNNPPSIFDMMKEKNNRTKNKDEKDE